MVSGSQQQVSAIPLQPVRVIVVLLAVTDAALVVLLCTCTRPMRTGVSVRSVLVKKPCPSFKETVQGFEPVTFCVTGRRWGLGQVGT